MQKITYGYAASPFGKMVIGTTTAGLCWLGFMVRGYKGDGEERLFAHFPGHAFVHDDTALQDIARHIVAAWEHDNMKNIKLDLHGTDFQKKVWYALLDIRKGHIKSYGDIARDIGNPAAARAVGSAVGENPVSLIVPCHRVITSTGDLGNYGWGVDLKQKILKAEGITHRIKPRRLAA